MTWDLNRKGMEKWSEFLGKKKHPWLDKVTSGLCGKPENNLFGQCIIVYGKQTGICIKKKGNCNTDFNWIRSMSIIINEWNTRDFFFKYSKKQGPLHLKPRRDHAK